MDSHVHGLSGIDVGYFTVQLRAVNADIGSEKQEKDKGLNVSRGMAPLTSQNKVS